VNTTDVSGTNSVGCIAASGAGDASNTAGDSSCASGTSVAGCVAMSGGGAASNAAGGSSCGAGTGAAGCAATSGGTGASNTAGGNSCGTGIAATGCAAATNGGDATNTAGDGSCGMVGDTIGGGCVAAAKDGLASNTAGANSCGSAQYIIACIAMSGGTASNVGCTPTQDRPQCIALTSAGGEAAVRQFFIDNLGCDSPETCDPVVRAIFMEQFGCDSPESCQARYFSGGGGSDPGSGGAGGGAGTGGGSGSGTTTGGTTSSRQASETDTTPPQTTLRSKKPRLARAATDNRKAIYVFRFRSSERDSTFQCKLDRRDWRRCSSPRRVKVAPGRHVFRVRAKDSSGNKDRTPAISRWRVRR
jgi:hypothetical protein